MNKKETERLNKIIGEKKQTRGFLMPLLQAAQAEFGFLSRPAIELIASETNLPLSAVYGVVTFYTQFRTTPPGKHSIKVCHGTACHVRGADGIEKAVSENLKIEVKETTPDGLFSYDSVACLGCCSLAPVIMVDEDVFGRLTPDKTGKVLRKYKDEHKK